MVDNAFSITVCFPVKDARFHSVFNGDESIAFAVRILKSLLTPEYVTFSKEPEHRNTCIGESTADALNTEGKAIAARSLKVVALLVGYRVTLTVLPMKPVAPG